MASFHSLFSVTSPEQTATVDRGGSRAPVVASSGQADLDAAFQAASHVTGLPFSFFLTTATRESSLDVHAAASTSSARGPFQFIEQTWLAMVHDHGDDLGLSDAAAAIERHTDGRYRIADAGLREDVLGLRHDPELSAVMTGLYVQENAEALENALGRSISVGEGYVAHVFGPSGASRLISLAEQQPNRVAADVFPTQAQANRGLFYTREGAPVSVRDLYDRLVEGFSNQAMPRGDTASAQVAAAASATREQFAESRRSGQPFALEPAGFDALPTRDAIDPDYLASRGLFSSSDNGSVPFFAALYRPDGWQASHLVDHVLSTQVADRPQAVPSASETGRQTMPHLGQIGLPLDLLGPGETGRLASLYRNPTEHGDGREILPSV